MTNQKNPVNQHFQEGDIRPEELKKNQYECIGADIELLLSRKREFLTVACPACNSPAFKSAFSKRGFRYVLCKRCKTLFMNPRPSPEILAWFYQRSQNYAYWDRYIFPATENARREKIFKPRVDRVLDCCEKFHSGMASLLEVGAAFGTFCVEMRSRNRFKRIVAVEPTPSLAATCRGKGIEIIEKPIETLEARYEGEFDVVVGFEVIEHLFSTREFVLQCWNLLRPGGLLILTCPNNRGFDFIVLGALCESVDHEHLNYLNPFSLSHLLASSGYKVLECQTPGRLDAELVRKKILSKDFDISGQPFLREILINQWEDAGNSFQQFLVDNRLSSHMWGVAQRPV